MKPQSIQSKAMSLAWRMYKINPELTFSICLKSAWGSIKAAWKHIKVETEYIVLKGMNNLLRSLKMVDVKGTKDWFKISTSRNIRKSEDPEVIEMIQAGHVPLIDIIHSRRRMSSQCTFVPRIERKRRPRIVSNYTDKVCNSQK